MEPITNHTNQSSSHRTAAPNAIKMVLFMGFFPSIYAIGKLVTQLF